MNIFMSKRTSSTILCDVPEHLQDGPPQRRPPGGGVDLAGAEKHGMVGDDANGRRSRHEVVQIPADDRAELLLQVGPLRLGQACSHRQTLQRNPFQKINATNCGLKPQPVVCSHHLSDGVDELTCRYRCRLSLSALSCCVTLWGSSRPSTMRKSSC